MAQVWEKSYPPGVRWDTPLPPAVPLESLLETTSTKWPDRTAIDFCDRTLTFRELHDLAARAAKGLQTLGVGPGVRTRIAPAKYTLFRDLLLRHSDGGRARG